MSVVFYPRDVSVTLNGLHVRGSGVVSTVLFRESYKGMSASKDPSTHGKPSMADRKIPW